MSSECKHLDDCGTHTASQASGLGTPSTASSGTRTRGCSSCTDGEKTACGECGRVHRTFYDRKVRRVRDLSCGGWRIYLDVEIRRVRCQSCGMVKQERLAWLADLPGYTQRFAFAVGRRCRASPLQDVAKACHLNWKTVKALELQYMREQLRRAGTPGPQVIGLDEVSLRQGHTYRIVVSDLGRHRPVWFGGTDRSEASLDLFFEALGPGKSQQIRLAVTDMWKAFRKATTRHAPQASILFDKFHVLRHLGDALDQARKSEYARLTGQDRRFIKGQKYTLLSHRAHLSLDGRRALRTLLRANTYKAPGCQ
jgi:transposase